MTKTKKLLRMKEKIEETGLELARFDGKLDDFKKRLKQKSGYGNIEKAKNVLKKLGEKLDKKEDIFEKGIVKLGEEYDW